MDKREGLLTHLTLGGGGGGGDTPPHAFTPPS